MAKSRPLLSHLLQRLADAGSEEPIIFTPKDVRASQKSELQDYLNAGWIQKGIITHTACIACDAQADITHPSPPLRALCGVCGTFFTVRQVDTLHYSTSFVQLAHWLCRLQEWDQPERISEGVYFLGHHEHQGKRFEVYVLCTHEKDATPHYNTIGESLSDDAIVMTLTPKPTPSKNNRIKPITLLSCLHVEQGAFRLVFTPSMLRQAHPTKQRAANTRWQHDPLQQQKDVIASYVKKGLTTRFAPPMNHAEIKVRLFELRPELMSYKKIDGTPATVTDKVLLQIIKDVLTEAGQQHRITGKYHAQ
jgi:hypothetical protein